MKIYIKYMFSARCKVVVKEELKKLGLHFVMVDLGEVDIMENLSSVQQEKLKLSLLASGFELIDDKRALLIEKIKSTIIEMVYSKDLMGKVKNSDFLSGKIGIDYAHLANIFSEVQGTTIEQYIICHKVERIKELIMYDELSISEIAWQMNYSSVAHLSNQFKKVTGFPPSHFKQLKEKRTIAIEEVEIQAA